MQLVILTYLYPEAIDYLYKLFPDLDKQKYTNQKEVIDRHISIWASGWEKAFEEQNIPILTIPTNIPQFLIRWAEENHLPFTDTKQIIIEMLKKFSPNVLFYDMYNSKLLEQIKANIPSIRLVALWKGSAPVEMEIFKLVDLIITCAPEEVSHLNNLGLRSEHLHHAFNKNLLENQKLLSKKYDMVFIGQIYKSIGFHINRDRILNKLVNELNLNIFSEAYNLTGYDFAIHFSKKAVLTMLLPFYFIANKVTGRYKSKLEKSLIYPVTPYSSNLKKFLNAPVYGKKMYDLIGASRIVLNIHADSSPNYASNMRLFETTGIGSCLLTDWKKNINELFKEDIEVVTYRSEPECVDKAKWLLNHDEERDKIGLSGQKRVFTSHLYEHRLPRLLEIFKKHLK